MSGSNGEQKTLCERLAAALAIKKQHIAREQEASFVGSVYFPYSDRRTCSICESPRLDPDITGLTCGRPECIAEVASKTKDYDALEAAVRKVADDFCTVSSTDTAETLAGKIAEEFDFTYDSLSDLTELIENDLAELLGIKTETEYLDEKQQRQTKKIEPKEILEQAIEQIKDLIRVIKDSEKEEST
jgi:hypothetical protein